VSSTEFYILDGDDEQEAQLVVTITDEGVVADVVVDGEVIRTWGRTAQEIADNYCT
jgi:hypothetical protein